MGAFVRLSKHNIAPMANGLQHAILGRMVGTELLDVGEQFGVGLERTGDEGLGETAEGTDVVVPIAHDEEMLLGQVPRLHDAIQGGALVVAGIAEAHVTPRAL